MEVIEWSRLIVKTLSVPLLRYSAPAVVPFSHVQEKRGIEGVRQDDLLVGTIVLPLCRGISGGLLRSIHSIPSKIVSQKNLLKYLSAPFLWLKFCLPKLLI